MAKTSNKSPEEKLRVVLSVLRGEVSAAAVGERVVLDAASGLVDGVVGQADHVERVGGLFGVGQRRVEGAAVGAGEVQNAPSDALAPLLGPRLAPRGRRPVHRAPVTAQLGGHLRDRAAVATHRRSRPPARPGRHRRPRRGDPLGGLGERPDFSEFRQPRFWRPPPRRPRTCRRRRPRPSPRSKPKSHISPTSRWRGSAFSLKLRVSSLAAACWR